MSKTNLTTAATEAVKYARLPRIPRSYIGWLNSLVSIPQNRATFMRFDKATTDKAFEKVAEGQYANDKGMLRQLLIQRRLAFVKTFRVHAHVPHPRNSKKGIRIYNQLRARHSEYRKGHDQKEQPLSGSEGARDRL